MMIYHYTLKRYLPSIRERGLLVSKARKKMRANWFVRSCMGAWACKHVLSKRMGGVQDIVCLTVDVPRSWLKNGHNGMYYTDRDIPPGRIVCVTGFTTEVLAI